MSCGAGITSANHALRCSNHRQADRQADRHTSQADRQTDRHTSQADRQADRHTRQADRHTRQADRHARQVRIKEFVFFVRTLFPLLADHISIYWM
jgi:regulator of protease activity HflC (stomatin/prohibitin superfamily)